MSTTSDPVVKERFTEAFLPSKEIRRNRANQFINWLQFSLISGLISIDSPSGLARITDDGMLRVTNGIFVESGYLELLQKFPIGFYSLGFRRNPLKALIGALEEFGYLKRNGHSSYLLPLLTIYGSYKDQLIVVSDVHREFGSAPQLSLQASKRINSRQKPRKAMHNVHAFLDWLHRDLEFGAISHNKRDSLVHFVPGGLLLRSPQALKEFLANHTFVGAVNGGIGTSKEPFRALQRELQKSGYLVFNEHEKSFFHRYELRSNTGNEEIGSGKIVSCYLLPNKTVHLNSQPAMSTCVRSVMPRETVTTSKTTQSEPS